MNNVDMNSVLTSVKKSLGIQPSDVYFDPELVMHINSVFGILHQLGVGPAVPFSITGPDETWDEFLQGDTRVETCKSYMYFRVKLMFDPPSSGVLNEAVERQISELEWRLTVMTEEEL